MTKFVVVSKPNPHLPHDSVELESPPPPDALNDEIAQKNAEMIISRLMHELTVPEPPEPAEAAETIPPAEPADSAAPTEATEPKEPTEPAAPVPAPRPAEADAADAPDLPLEAAVREALNEDSEIEDEPEQSWWARLRLNYGIILVAALMAYFRPVLLGAIVLGLIWLVATSFVLLRHAVAGGRWQRFARRFPGTAERVRRKADGLAVRIDRVLDILPARWAESLSLPDLSQPVPPMPRSRRRRTGGHGYT